MAKDIRNLLVVPLIASAILLSSPSLITSASRMREDEVRHTTSLANTKNAVVGTVAAVSGIIIKVTARDNVVYTVDASHATIMKSTEAEENPAIVDVSGIKVGDTIMVRGTVDFAAVDA